MERSTSIEETRNVKEKGGKERKKEKMRCARERERERERESCSYVRSYQVGSQFSKYLQKCH